MLNTIGERIRFYREQLQMTQEDLADASGIDRVSIARYETDVRKPSSKSLIKLARALNVTTNDILEDGNADSAKPINAMEFAVLSKTKDFSDDEWADLNAQADIIIARRNRKQG